jgi:hypothetical protein
VRHLSALGELRELSLIGTLFTPTAATQQLQQRVKRMAFARASINYLL